MSGEPGQGRVSWRGWYTEAAAAGAAGAAEDWREAPGSEETVSAAAEGHTACRARSMRAALGKIAPGR